MARILIVDDSKFQRTSIRKKLADMGHDVLEATNGDEALAKISSEPLNCVITDLHMPSMNGFDFIRNIKSLGKPIPILVLSADIQQKTVAEITQLGACGFLSKPIQDEAFAASIAKALSAA